MTCSFWRALACVALLAACDGDSGSGFTPDAGNHSRDGAVQGDGDVGDGDVGDGDVGDGDGDGDVRDGGEDPSRSDAGHGDSGSVSGDGDAAAAEMGAHCSPGKFLASFAGDAPDHADRCDDQGWQDALQAGVYEEEDLARTDMWDIELAVPMTAGKPYALSLELQQRGNVPVRSMEMWGATGTCGAGGGATKLYSMPLPVGLYAHCLEVTPAVGYTHLIMKLHDAPGRLGEEGLVTALRSATFCAMGACQ